MRPDVKETRSGVNEFIEDQQKIEGKCLLTITKFNTVRENLVQARPVDDIQPLTESNYRPGGSTALLDAIGFGINEAGVRFHNMPETDRPDRVLFVIVIDGQENRSQEFSYSRIKSMVEHQQNTYGWEFVFLGADIDVFKEQTKLGVRHGYGFSKENGGMHGAMKSVSLGVVQARTSGAEWQEAYNTGTLQGVADGELLARNVPQDTRDQDANP